VYALIFVLQAASAAFTPTFQATIPDVLPDEAEYTRALSLSQLAYNLENLVSPALAAALLTVISFHWLFAGTAIGFLASAALVVSVLLPSPKPAAPRGVYDRTTRGIRLYLATPRLRGLLPLWLVLGLGYSAVGTPTGRLLRRSAHPEDRPTLFAAQFALSHACWLLTYPLAGWLGARAGIPVAFAALAGVAALAALAAARLWSAGDPDTVPHVHRGLDPAHPHLAGADPVAGGGFRHAHAFVIDNEHAAWPKAV